METELWEHINRFKKFYNLMFRDLQEQYHLSQLELDILLFLDHNPQYNTARDICEIRNLAKSNVSNSLRHLEELGILRSEQDAVSRKIRRLFITEQAQGLMEVLTKHQKQCYEILSQQITEEEKKIMDMVFAKFDRNLRDALEKLEEND